LSVDPIARVPVSTTHANDLHSYNRCLITCERLNWNSIYQPSFDVIKGTSHPPILSCDMLGGFVNNEWY